jgi:aspartate/methionine/tyrosine aminotransferase
MDAHETHAKYNIAETCCASISISDLLSLSENPDTTTSPIPTTEKLTYGPIRGSSPLRTNLSSLYSARSSTPLTEENILITPGAIAANFLVLYSLLSPGDHVICHYPTYSQLYQIPRSLGADVSLWKADPTKKWQLDTSTLKSLIRPNKTKLLILNNPNNPTGSIIPRQTLEEILDLAKEHGIVVLSDEVYRPIFHSLAPSDASFPPSAVNVLPSYPNVVVTGSMSKAYALAGIRVGWIATRSRGLMERFAETRHFTTISVSQLDEAVAAAALSEHCIHALLARNIHLAKTNLALLEEFVEGHTWACSWVKPVAGTTALVRFSRNGKPVDDVGFCEKLLVKTGVLVVPAERCFEDRFQGAEADRDGEGEQVGNGDEGGFAGCVRVGFVCETEVLREALGELRRFMEDEFDTVPVLSKKKEG